MASSRAGGTLKRYGLTVCVLSLISGQALAGQPISNWPSSIPRLADQPSSWYALLDAFKAKQMHYGVLASSTSMLRFFSDLQAKETAYRSLIDLVDQGYPFSTRSYFVPGDIDPPLVDNFARTYFLQKAIVNEEKKMEKWAQFFFSKLDAGTFAKYTFYKAITAYSQSHLDEALELLQKTLSLVDEGDHLAIRAARTMARIYYEQQKYDRALEIYQTFLLKLNPVEPKDWLETAWTQYQLKHFPEALGLLYNFENDPGSSISLERYVLRALIYREYCDLDSTQNLVKSFEAEFGEAVDGIKMGEPLYKFAKLQEIEHPDVQSFRQYVETLANLKAESKRISELPKAVRSLAVFVYSSEIALTQRRVRMLEDPAREVLARHLVILSESLRFLEFDVERVRFDPDRVFALAPVQTEFVDDLGDQSFRLHWLQKGDYWRDERALYKGILVNQCGK